MKYLLFNINFNNNLITVKIKANVLFFTIGDLVILNVI